MPSSGGLSILYRNDLDKPAVCYAVIELLYGAGSVEQRLQTYLDFVSSRG
jgi:hypothetical protein